MRTRRIRGAAAFVALTLAFALAGCGQGAPTPTPPGGTVTTEPSASPSGVSPRPTLPTVPPTTTPVSGARTVRGEIFEGVEANCLLLRSDDGAAYLLLGGDRSVINSGGRLEVVGEARPGLVTTCQQGIPFSVTSVRRI